MSHLFYTAAKVMFFYGGIAVMKIKLQRTIEGTTQSSGGQLWLEVVLFVSYHRL